MEELNPYEPPSAESTDDDEVDVLYEIARCAAQGTPYPPEAFVFLVQGFEFAKQHIQHERKCADSMDATDLSWCLHDLAVYRFGENARATLEAWNVRSTRDFGNLVFRLVDMGRMQTEDSDTIDDFADVFDFSNEFKIQEFRPTLLFDEDV